MALGTLVAVLALGAAEIGVRLLWDAPLPPYPVGFDGPRPGHETGALLTYDPELFWRQRPNAEAAFDWGGEGGIVLRTNDLGLRDDPFPSPGDGPRFFALCMGDSNTWGDGVLGRETYANVLEQRIADEHPGAVIDVLNAGGPGYSTTQSLRLQRELLEGYSFDLVTIYNMGADMAFSVRPDSAYEKGPVAAMGARLLASSALFRRARRVVFAEEDARRFAYERADMPHRVPAEPDYHRQLQAMVEEAMANGARVLLVLPLPLCVEPGCAEMDGRNPPPLSADVIAALQEAEGEYREVMRQVAAETGAPLLDLPAWSETHPDPASLYLDISHPTPEGHRAIAHQMHEAIEPVLEAWRDEEGLRRVRRRGGPQPSTGSR